MTRQADTLDTLPTVAGGLPTDARFVPGDRIGGRWRVEGLIGRGARGEVYRVVDLTTGRTRALKRLHPDRRRAERERVRFRAEAALAQELVHPGIVRTYDVASDAEADLYTMEFVEGGSLRARIRRLRDGEPLTIARALDIVDALLEALEHAHRSTVHGDVKPENVLLTPEGRVKLADFGTGAGGTPPYLAPEARLGERADARADLFAVGMILYELLTGGELPIGRYEPPSRLRRGLDRRADAVVARALEPDPAARWQSATAMRAALAAVRRTSRSGHRVVAMLFLYTGLVGGLLVWGRVTFLSAGRRAASVAHQVEQAHEAPSSSALLPALVARARGHYAAGRLAGSPHGDDAEGLYRRVLELDPHHAEALRRLEEIRVRRASSSVAPGRTGAGVGADRAAVATSTGAPGAAPTTSGAVRARAPDPPARAVADHPDPAIDGQGAVVRRERPDPPDRGPGASMGASASTAGSTTTARASTAGVAVAAPADAAATSDDRHASDAARPHGAGEAPAVAPGPPVPVPLGSEPSIVGSSTSEPSTNGPSTNGPSNGSSTNGSSTAGAGADRPAGGPVPRSGASTLDGGRDGGREGLRGQVSVGRLERLNQGYLEVALFLENVGSDPVSFEYRVAWLDDAGRPLGAAAGPWHEVAIDGGATRRVTELAPRRDVQRYEVQARGFEPAP